VASLGELMEMAKELGVKLIACQMSMDVMGIKKEDLIDGVEIGGAATFLEFASHNAITLTF
jgi:peroxiredoxin family protein